jgi:tetratricopeptide (TPR) repeat protein
LGVLFAVGLVAMIGLPVAWLTVGQYDKPAAELSSREAADLKTFDVAEDAAADAPAPAPKLPAVAFEPQSSAPPTPVAANRGEELTPEAAAPSAEPSVQGVTEVASAEADHADSAADPRSRSGLAQARMPAASVAPSSPAAAPPPPPAPPAVQEARAATKPREDLAAADMGDSIVVTSAKRRGRAVPDRGDWNACTINDPKRSLSACKYLVNPGAKGINGKAATHLADGLSLAWQGIMDRAIAAFDQAIAIAPKSSLAYLNRGLAYRRQGDADRALADLDKAVRLAPSAARGYYNRSLLLRQRGDTRRAEADQMRAVSLDADYEEVVH